MLAHRPGLRKMEREHSCREKAGKEGLLCFLFYRNMVYFCPRETAGRNGRKQFRRPESETSRVILIERQENET